MASDEGDGRHASTVTRILTPSPPMRTRSEPNALCDADSSALLPFAMRNYPIRGISLEHMFDQTWVTRFRGRQRLEAAMHLITDTALAIRDQMKSSRGLNATFIPTEEKRIALLALAEAEAEMAALKMELMACADDVAQAEGFTSIATWIAHHIRVRRSDAAADHVLAKALECMPILATALREAAVNLDQARVIARAVSELPRDAGDDTVARAEAELVRLAAQHDPKELATLGRRILEVVDPERFEAEEARNLAKLEQHAMERQRLKMRALGDGTTRLTALVPDHVAARLSTYLHAFTNPRLTDGTARSGPGEQDTTERHAFGLSVNHPRRMAEAFNQLLESVDPTRLPIHGGDATHVVVTVPLEALSRELGTATIDNQVPGDGNNAITAAQARRLACTARIIPAVLGADSEVLDLGRASRLFTKAQRRALLLRDRTCRAEGCTIPGSWAEAHHLLPWSAGGSTDTSNAALLCSRHHHRAHDAAYDLTRLPNGDIRFTRRN